MRESFRFLYSSAPSEESDDEGGTVCGFGVETTSSLHLVRQRANGYVLMGARILAPLGANPAFGPRGRNGGLRLAPRGLQTAGSVAQDVGRLL